MKFDYDKETDSLYIEFASGAGADNILITDDIVADIDRNWTVGRAGYSICQ